VGSSPARGAPARSRVRVALYSMNLVVCRRVRSALGAIRSWRAHRSRPGTRARLSRQSPMRSAPAASWPIEPGPISAVGFLNYQKSLPLEEQGGGHPPSMTARCRATPSRSSTSRGGAMREGDLFHGRQHGPRIPRCRAARLRRRPHHRHAHPGSPAAHEQDSDAGRAVGDR